MLRPTAPRSRLRRDAAWGFRSSRAPLGRLTKIRGVENMSRIRESKRDKQKKLPPPEKVVGITIDNEKQWFITYTDDMLINQIKRDSVKIASSFDKLCDSHLQEISRLASVVLMVIHRGIIKASRENDELRLACLEMLTNAANSYVAAATLLRNGYRLQPGILIRSIFETISTVLHLFISPDELKDFREGRLQSSKTILVAKDVLPPFGVLYGYFSQQFAHVGTLHQSLQPLTSYDKFDDALETNILFLRLTSWLLYVTTELVCYEVVGTPRYWQYLGKNEQGSMYAYKRVRSVND